MGERPLVEVYPCLFHLSRAKGALMAEIASLDSFSSSWNFHFPRSLNDYEALVSLLLFIQVVFLDPYSPDRWSWTCHSFGNFSHKSFFDVLIEDVMDPAFPMLERFGKLSFPKVRILAWCAVLQRTNTNDMVQKNRSIRCLSL